MAVWLVLVVLVVVVMLVDGSAASATQRPEGEPIILL